MKKFIPLMLACSLSFGLCGCLQQEEKVTSADLMNDINSKNVLEADPVSRIWYQVDPLYFAPKDSETGTLQGLIDQIPYLTDNDVKTKEDLNINGIFLTHVFSYDDNNALVSSANIDPAIGTLDDLKEFCDAAHENNCPVIVSVRISSYSKQSDMFQSVEQAAKNYKEKEPSKDKLDSKWRYMFMIETEGGEGKSQIGNTPFYVQVNSESGAPLLDYNPKGSGLSAFKWLCTRLNDAGVNGIYIEDSAQLTGTEDMKHQDILNEMLNAYHEINPSGLFFVNETMPDENVNEEIQYVQQNYAGAEGPIAKAVTGTISASALADGIKEQSHNAILFLNNDDSTLDLLKSDNRMAQYKMALGIHLMQTGQVFISAGDELGLKKGDIDFTVDAIQKPEEENISLEFGDFEEQKKDGNSIFNYVVEAIAVRDAYEALSRGESKFRDDLSSDTVAVIEKTSNESHVFVVYNLSGQAQSLDISGIEIMGLPAELGGVLLTGDKEATLENGTLSMPPFSIAILK